ncbi:response regulator transcription factor [Dorea sp.]|nr:response regulator transcription factor [uncultured Dorea sp.]
MQIVIVEDDEGIRKELKRLLENAFYQVTVIESFTDVAGQIRVLCPAADLVLLDLNLPGESGFDVCRKLREYSDIPIIFLTSRTDSMDELTGILNGADDYITKPFNPPILLARIGVVLKRTTSKNAVKSTNDTIHLEYKGVTLNLAGAYVEHAGKKTDLTKNELKILHLLYQKKGEIVPRMDMIEYLWDNEVFIDDNTLSVNVTRLRNKLSEIGVKDFIETKRGMGYRI